MAIAVSRQVEQTFGLLIAFVFPGLIGLAAIGLHVPLIMSWFGATDGPGLTVAELLRLLVVSSGVGVVLSGIRWAVYERALEHFFPRYASEEMRTKHDEGSEQALQNAIMQLYRYYQCYANTSIAVLVLFVSWCFRTAGPNVVVVGVAAVAAALLLGYCAHSAWHRDQTDRAAIYSKGGVE